MFTLNAIARLRRLLYVRLSTALEQLLEKRNPFPSSEQLLVV